MATRDGSKAADTRATLVLGPDVLVEAVVGELGGNREDLQVVRPEEDGLLKAIDLLAQPSMFAVSGNAVWIRGLRNEPQAEVDAFLEVLLAGLAVDTRVIATATGIDKRSRLYKFFVKQARVIDLRLELERNGRLRREDVMRLVGERVKEAGLPSFAKAAVEEICRRSGGDVAQLFQEIDKLILWQQAREPVTAEVVREVMVDQAGSWVFDLTDALGARALERALRVVSRLLEGGEPPLRLTSMLATRVAALLEARRAADRIGSDWTGLSYAAFIAGPYKRLSDTACKRFPPNYGTYRVFEDAAAFATGELRRLHGSLLTLDRSLKRSAVSASAGLTQVLEAACLVGR